jgi:hypothetical protein
MKGLKEILGRPSSGLENIPSIQKNIDRFLSIFFEIKIQKVNPLYY